MHKGRHISFRPLYVSCYSNKCRNTSFLLDSKDDIGNPEKHNNEARNGHCVVQSLKDF